MCFQNFVCIFRAELYALLLAIDVVRRSKEKNFVIFSDSMSHQHMKGHSVSCGVEEYDIEQQLTKVKWMHKTKDIQLNSVTV